MAKAYVVMPDVEYEHATPVRVFLSKPEAEAFLVVLKEYDAKRPVEKEIPRPRWPEEQVKEHDLWWKRYLIWRERHPAGEEGLHHRRFTICEVPLGRLLRRRRVKPL